jgi:hypothetical protein
MLRFCMHVITEIARFITEDTYGGENSDPLSLNRYTYALNNPIFYTDPTGHWAKGDEDLSSDKQDALLVLTNQYYNPPAGKTKASIQAEAAGIRSGTVNPYQIVGNKTDSSTVSIVVQSLVNNNNLPAATKLSIGNSALGVFTNANLSYHEDKVNTTIATLNQNLASAEKTFWNSNIFTNNWEQNKTTLKIAVDAISNEVRLNGSIDLPSNVYANKMGAIQRITGTPTVNDNEWGVDTLNTIQNIMTHYRVQGDATVLDSANLSAIIKRYDNGLIGQKSGDFLQRTGLYEAPYDVAYGLLGGTTSSKNGSNSSGGTPKELKLNESTNPDDYLNAGLKRQGLDKSPSSFKEKWSEDGFDYEVRVHPADSRYENTGRIIV